MKPLYLPRVEFYVTNVCNFNCTGCNRFNNINFSGKQKWSDFELVYKKWSQVLDINEFVILGGEPMTNPDYLDWISGINRLWPDAIGSLMTNGHYLKSDNVKLYNILAESNQKLFLNIGLHNEQRTSSMIATVEKFLHGNITVTRIPENVRELQDFDHNWAVNYHRIKDLSWPNCNTIDDWNNLPSDIQYECEKIHNFSPDMVENLVKGWKLVDSNGVTVSIRPENYFSQGSLKFDNNIATLHSSDPTKAHSNCEFVKSKCYSFTKGKLYKCGPVALFPELDEKFKLNLSDQDRQLLHDYHPGDVSVHSIKQLKLFLHKIDSQIDQCQFCPENHFSKKIAAEHGKKIIKLIPFRNR